MGEFQDYTEKKYNENPVRSWCDILLYNSGDEGKALELFFEDFFGFIDDCVSD